MSLHALGGDEFDAIAMTLRGFTREVIDACLPVEGPAELELLALGMIGPFGDPEMPLEAAGLLPRALSDRGDALAAGILTCLERLAPQPLSRSAAEARARLARRGIVSPLDDDLGALVVEESYAIPLGAGRPEMLGALLRRPGRHEFQGALLVVEHVPCGGMIIEGLLSDPGEPEALRAQLRRPHAKLRGEMIGSDELARRLLAVLGHMVDHQLLLRADLLTPLLILERALGGGVGRWPQPRLELVDEDDDEIDEIDEIDETDETDDDDDEAELAAARAYAEELVEAFAASLAAASEPRSGLDSAPGVAETLCRWKLEEAVDHRVEHWTTRELERFLLVWYPQSGDGRQDAVDALPDGAELFLRFLAGSGRLGGDAIDVLVATLTRLRRPFREAALDPARWGIGKTLAMQMWAEGVDPAEPGAAEAWLQEFDARPDHERERVIGRAFDPEGSAAPIRGVESARGGGAPTASETRPERRKARRRAAKASRRRNRR